MSLKIILTYLFVGGAWSVYRYFISLPVWIEETVVKGLFFVAPIIVLPPLAPVFTNLGITRKNFLKSVSLGIVVGVALGLTGQISSFLRHGQFITSFDNIVSGSFGALIILSLITAFWEQLLFSGYFLSKLQQAVSGELLQVGLVGIGFSLIHLPALIFIQHMVLAQVVVSSSLLFFLGASCAILRLRLQNLIAPIMVHAMWGITIFLFS